MPRTVQTILETPTGYRSPEVARFAWMLDEQRQTLLAETQDLPPEALEWQPAPGMNTIGMLLAHIAYAENHIVTVGVEGKETSDTKGVIGLSVEEEGMPLGPDAPPSPALAGKEFAYFEQMLEKARTYTREALKKLKAKDLERRIVRDRPDGSKREFNVGWVLYHLLEHEAGHRGQISLLRHQRRDRKKAEVAARQT